MIKRTVGLRPIKYSKLPPNVRVGLFNAKKCEQMAIEESFLKYNKNGFIRDESEMWKNWNDGKQASDLDYVLLFSQIPHNALKDIWYITGCDKIMKFASFNRIYNQCVCGEDILWVNCNKVEHIQQKIRWDKLIIKNNDEPESNEYGNVETDDAEEESRVTNKVMKTQMNTSNEDEKCIESPLTESIVTQTTQSITTQSSLTQINVQKKRDDYSVVNVIDNTDNEIRTWVYNLPKKIVSIDENGSESGNDENGGCTIL